MQPYSSPSRRIISQQPKNPHEQPRLSWLPIHKDILLTGETQINTLKNIRNTVLSIRRQFQTNTDPKIHLNPLNRDDFNKRMMLLQSQVQGLMKRKINYSSSTSQNGQRSLDYTNLLNQKQNQVIQLEKKIQNLQFRLRKASSRQIQLQNHIVFLNSELRIKQQIINGKNQIILAEVASSNAIKDALNKIRRNVENNKHRVQDLQRIVFNQVNIPDVGSFQIRSQSLTKVGALSRSRSYQQLTASQQSRIRIVQLFRQIQRIIASQNGQISDVQIQRALQGYLNNFKQSRLYQKSSLAAKRADIQQKYKKLKQNFAFAAGIYNQNLQKLRKDNPNIRISLQRNLFEILQRQNVKAYQVQSGAVFIDAYTQKTVQVPVQDARTKHLIHLLATQMKKFTTKYPQLLKQMDRKLLQFFQQQIIDVIEVDQVDRLVNIVKYVPQVVKVQNVYSYSSEKTRKVQFHLRVLIKALLEQLHKIKLKTGVVLQMDEGVLGMISAEIMGIVSVDDILKVFRPVPKIVQVQKIVQKIVQRRVQVPIVIPITKQVQKIIQVQKIVQIQKIVNVPLQIPIVQMQLVDRIVPIQRIVQKLVQVPKIVERIVYIDRQVPKIVQIQKIVQKIVQVQKIIQVQRVVNHIQQQPEQIQIQVQRIVPVQTIVQKLVEVPIIRQKIVQKIVQVPKIHIVEKIVQKVVPMVQYRKALQVINHIETIHKPVDRIIQKIVPIQRIVERIVQVPQIIEKIVQVKVQKIQYRQIEVIKQKLVKQEVIKPVQVVTKQIVPLIRQVIKQVEKYIQIPVIHEVVKIVQEKIQVPFIQNIQTQIIKQVYLRDPMIVYEPKIVEVERIVNHYIEVPKPVRYIQQRIVQIPRNVDRIKQVRVQIDRVIQKMVEVPKVVQVQRIVQKIVVVPRVIEKIIQVPQIVQKIVIKQVQKIVVRQIQKQIQVPVIQQKIVEVQVIKNVYIQIQKPVERIVEKLVTVTNTKEVVVPKQFKVQNTIQVIRQVPKIVHVDKIVPMYYQELKVVEKQQVIIVPHQIAVPVEVVVEKLLPMREIVEKIVQVPQFIQKIVQIRDQSVRVQYIQKIVEKIVVDERIKEVEKIIPYIQQVIKQIPTIVQKIITVETKVQQIITAQQIIQKLVERSTTIPRIYQVQKIVPKLVRVPQIIQVERIIPQIHRVNQYVQRIVQKIIQVPRMVQRIREIQVQREKIVTLREEKTNIVEVEKIVQKIAILEQFKQVIKSVNHIQRVVQIVQKIEKCPLQVRYKQQIFVEIPTILQKIVEKIVIMPQIVQVLKYVHQIAQSNELYAVQNQKQYKDHEFKLITLTKNMKPSLDNLIRQLRSLKNVTQLNGRIQIIEGFMVELDKLIAFPKLIKIKSTAKQERIVQVQKIVKVPVQDEHHLRKQISMSILVQKLILQIKRIIAKTNCTLQLDDEIKMIFFAQLQTSNRFTLEGELKDKFNRFALEINRKFQSLGPWAYQNQLMLNTILQERFKLAQIVQSANVQIQRAQHEYQNAMILLNSTTKANQNCHQMLNRLKAIYRSYSSEKQSQMTEIKKFIEDVQKQQAEEFHGEPTRQLTRQSLQSSIYFQNYESKLRQKQATINKLKQTIHSNQRRQSTMTQSRISQRQSQYVKHLQSQVQRLKTEKSGFDTRADLSKVQDSYRRDLSLLQQRNQTLQKNNSQLKNDLQNAQRQLRVLHLNQKFIMRKGQGNKISQQPEWNMKRSGHYSQSLSHSAIRRVEDSLSQSQYSYQYGGRFEDPRQSPSAYFKNVVEKQRPQQSGLMTPLQVNKYRSPESTQLKYTQSFLRQESRSVAGQSPQTHPIFTTPGSIKYTKEDEPKQKKEEDSSISKYRYYYSPDQRGKP